MRKFGEEWYKRELEVAAEELKKRRNDLSIFGLLSLIYYINRNLILRKYPMKRLLLSCCILLCVVLTLKAQEQLLISPDDSIRSLVGRLFPNSNPNLSAHMNLQFSNFELPTIEGI